MTQKEWISCLCPSCHGKTMSSETSCMSCGHEVLLNGRYALLAPQGSMGMDSNIFKARDLNESRDVILKHLDLADLGSWEALERKDQQFKLLRGLNHPGIPRAIERFEVAREEGTRIYHVYELIDGHSLQERLEGGSGMDERAAIKLMKQILPTLNYLHSLSPAVAHGGISPSTLFLNEDGRLLLTGFEGMEGVYSGLVDEEGLGYEAPERLRDEIFPASDIYSLGATMIHLLSGQSPGEMSLGKERLEFEAHVRASPAFLRVLSRMVEPDRAQRYTSAGDVIRALSEMAGRPAQQPVVGPPVAVAVPPPGTSHVAPIVISLVVAAVLFLGGIIAYTMFTVASITVPSIPSIPHVRSTPHVSMSMPPSPPGPALGSLSQVNEDWVSRSTPHLTWASAVQGYSSEYSPAGWCTSQILGPPNVFPSFGDVNRAWASRSADGSYEYIEVMFPPTEARAVVILQTYNPGALVRVDDLSTSPALLWQGPISPSMGSRADLITLTAPRPLSLIRLVLDSSRVTGWNEIDAVGLVPQSMYTQRPAQRQQVNPSPIKRRKGRHHGQRRQKRHGGRHSGL